MSMQTEIVSPEPVEPVAPERAAPPAKRSAVEGIKESSRQLRGGIALELVKDSDHFSDQDKQLLKFHGSYQQEDRDARKTRVKPGVGKQYQFMIRCKIPGGRLSAAQYLAVDELAAAFANGTLRFTSRQGIQLHGVLKNNLKEAIAGINACLLTTLGACGDVTRNVMACPAPHYQHGVHAQLQETASVLAAQFAPRSRAYHEIWLDGERVDEPAAAPGSNGAAADVEPLYGKVYLPRKFKIGLALPEDNCIDIYAQDLGLLAIVENGVVVGYNVLVGGGMGMTHGNANTFPHLSQPICYVPASAVAGAAEAVIRLFRDHGNRADRKRARIKYLVHDWGVDLFRQRLAAYVGGALHPPRPVEVRDFDPHLGWHPQGNGQWYYGLSIENGRVKNDGSLRLRTCLRTLVEHYQPDIRLTGLQDILLCNLPADARPEIERLLAEHGVSPPDQLSTVQKFSMACPAIPTCGLALSESERVMPRLIDQLEAELKRLGLEEEKISVRMTGCPNGCARPYQSDIGIVGRSGDNYTLFVGGNLVGSRLNFVLRDLVPLARIVPTLTPLFEHYRQERRPREGFGDYCQRLGIEQLQALLPAEAKPVRAAAQGEADGNGDVHAPPILAKDRMGGQAALAPPETRLVPLGGVGRPAPDSGEAQPASDAALPFQQSETFLTGLPGEELRDHAYRYHTDGSVKETLVYFYGNDQRAGTARPEDPLRREAVYLGQADPARLHAARKLSDTYYVGPPGHERPDRRVEYHADAAIARTILFYYEDGLRAADASSGDALRKQVAYQGPME